MLSTPAFTYANASRAPRVSYLDRKRKYFLDFASCWRGCFCFVLFSVKTPPSTVKSVLISAEVKAKRRVFYSLLCLLNSTPLRTMCYEPLYTFRRRIYSHFAHSFLVWWTTIEQRVNSAPIESRSQSSPWLSHVTKDFSRMLMRISGIVASTLSMGRSFNLPPLPKLFSITKHSMNSNERQIFRIFCRKIFCNFLFQPHQSGIDASGCGIHRKKPARALNKTEKLFMRFFPCRFY